MLFSKKLPVLTFYYPQNVSCSLIHTETVTALFIILHRMRLITGLEAEKNVFAPKVWMYLDCGFFKSPSGESYV